MRFQEPKRGLEEEVTNLNHFLNVYFLNNKTKRQPSNKFRSSENK